MLQCPTDFVPFSRSISRDGTWLQRFPEPVASILESAKMITSIQPIQSFERVKCMTVSLFTGPFKLRLTTSRFGLYWPELSGLCAHKQPAGLFHLEIIESTHSKWIGI